ncbi:MAG: hypothetical protein QW171_03845 [Candidatus Bilamarchaeaceae archaeon]
MQKKNYASDHLVEGDWNSFAVLLNRLDLSNVRGKSLRKKSYFIKNILHLQMREFNGSGTVDASLFVGYVRLLMKLEKEFGEGGHEFITFLKIFIRKMATQRLVVNKVLERRLEFEKMKRVIEQ